MEKYNFWGITLKRLIIPLLFCLLLLGCTSASPKLDKTYSYNNMTYKASSDWKYVNQNGADYHYLSNGSMLFISCKTVPGSANNSDKQYSYMKSAYDGFVSTAKDVNDVSENFDSKNTILTATYKADYGDGKVLVNYYSTVKGDKLYCVAFAGKTYSEGDQTKLFNSIIKTISYGDK